MKQVYIGKKAFVDNVPAPIAGDKEVLVRVEFSLISTGTETSSLRKKEKSFKQKLNEDLQLLDKIKSKLTAEGIKPTWEKITNKINPTEDMRILSPRGYSNAGIIIAKGNGVTEFNVGDRVACAGSGIAAHAEYVAIPKNLVVKIPDNLSFKDAAFTTVSSIALQGLRRANINPGETVVITGLGLLGLIAIQIAKAWGMIAIGIDLVEERVKKGEQLGADLCVNASDPNLEDKILHFTSGNGVDAVIINAATQSSEPANQGLRLCRKRGRVVVVGAIGMQIERSSMYKKELDFVISTSYGPGRYDPDYEEKGIDYPYGFVRWTENRNMQEVVRLLSEKKIDTEELISDIFPVYDAEKAFKSLVDPEQNKIGVLISYRNEKTDREYNNVIKINPKTVTESKINVGVIGSGGFASRNHLPNVGNLPEYYSLVAIADINPSISKMAGNKFKPNYITTDYKKLLEDKSIDLIIITTRHNVHAKLVIESLKAGKHVLVEKPLAMTQSELDEIRKVLNDSKKHLAVGFNRRYSPFIQKVKQYVTKNSGPVFINYRINAGFLPTSHWTQNPKEGGGRIIGEGCHFIDLCNYIADSDIKEINLGSIPVNDKEILSKDNISITISYENGSLAVISYVCIGSKKLAKEQLEIATNKSSIVIDEFIRMKMYDTGESDTELKKVDKGHFREMEELGKLIKGEKTLIPSIELDLLASQISIDINNSFNIREKK